MGGGGYSTGRMKINLVLLTNLLLLTPTLRSSYLGQWGLSSGFLLMSQ